MEFKKLSAVEAVDSVSDTANILIEEDGIIKKVPKAAVGDASDNEELDLDIELIEDGESINPRNWSYNINFINTFENIKNKLLNGIKPKCKAKVLATAWGGDPSIKAVEIFDSLQVYYQPQDDSAERSEVITFKGIGAHISPEIKLFPNNELNVTN